MKKSICIVLFTVLLIFTSRFIYHEICARATYDGVIVGSHSVRGAKSICFFNPNHENIPLRKATQAPFPVLQI